MINDGRFVWKDVTLYAVCMRDDIWIQKGHCAVNEERTGHNVYRNVRIYTSLTCHCPKQYTWEKYCRFILHSLKMFQFCVHVIISIFLWSPYLFFLLPLSLICSISDSVVRCDVLPGIHTHLYIYLR